MTYRPPVSQILLAMQVAGFSGDGIYSDFSADDARAVLDEAGRFAAERIAPLNWIGDQNPAELVNGKVVTPPGWRDTYRDWCAGGWNSLTGAEKFDGQALPFLMSAACTELWNSASMSFALCPLLTAGAIEAIAAHASEDLKQLYLPKLVSGEWSGTMNLTEPQSGSDLSGLRCKARRHDDGHYHISGSKIYITYGEHDLTSNIAHLVLARLDGAPTGTRGISLFLVPKILPDGSPNDVRCHSLEHKLGIHGSPTCTMIYGDKGGATGWLIGEENQGLACMFTMMNNARVLVAVQGAALAERAMQAAIAFARERKQGRVKGREETCAIIEHPDIKRMLLDMRAKTSAARMLCLATAAAIDASVLSIEECDRKKAEARASLLTPLAKSFATDIAVDVASSALQVHGGMGFIEDTGVAQYYRDARILPIYEGTNGIQAIDLVTRKLELEDGQLLRDVISMGQSDLSTLVGADIARQLATNIRVLSEQLRAMSGTAKLAVATTFTRALASFFAAGYLAKAVGVAGDGTVGKEANSNARYFIATELHVAIAAAQSAVIAADFVVTADMST